MQSPNKHITGKDKSLTLKGYLLANALIITYENLPNSIMRRCFDAR
jgi:hypothetical protein